MSGEIKAELWGLAGTIAFIVSAFLCLALLSGCGSVRPVPTSRVETVGRANATAKIAASAVIVSPAPSVAVRWQLPEFAGPMFTEVWASTNLATWQLKTNIAGNAVAFPATMRGEFYKIRCGYSVGNLMLFTDWARR